MSIEVETHDNKIILTTCLKRTQTAIRLLEMQKEQHDLHGKLAAIHSNSLSRRLADIRELANKQIDQIDDFSPGKQKIINAMQGSISDQEKWFTAQEITEISAHRRRIDDLAKLIGLANQIFDNLTTQIEANPSVGIITASLPEGNND